jgi:hypothetical protein
MGLDIMAYRKLTPANGNEAFYETGELKYEDGWTQFYKNLDFPGRADDIQDCHAYKAEDSEVFYAGGYGGYGRWRDQLAELAGYPLTKYMQYGQEQQSYAAACWEGAEGPFSELINFSDCEGVIGAAVSAKLAKDFADHQAKADAHQDERFRSKYAEWRKAFEMAADGGAVRFH